ncbi:MAG: isopentenyl-diphosphate delta-isomerase, partial [Gammaproteobacteria bacterium]|nr:isopentenyl-diphosphate delta-isomerase [Gammaproteobacteria bacterium]
MDNRSSAALNDAVVSFDADDLILVDEHDNEIGHMSKDECHIGDGQLHRAFSLFVFNSEGELLLQQRSKQKHLWPLYWANSCCSHPRHGESMDDAVRRRTASSMDSP